MSQLDKYLFRPAEIRQSGDRCYVYCRAYNPKKKKLDTYRKYVSRRFKKSQQLRQGNLMAERINMLLEKGWNPFTDDFENQFSLSIPEAIKKGIEHATSGKSHRTLLEYSAEGNLLSRWAVKKGIGDRHIMVLDKFMALEYMDHISRSGIKPITYNNKRNRLSTIFTQLVDRNHIFENPFKKVKYKPEEDPEIRPFTKEELGKYVEYIQTSEPRLFMPSAMIFYLALRPIEITRLKVRHFELENSVVKVPGWVSKNNKTRYVTIPEQFKDRLKDFFKGAQRDWQVLDAKRKWKPGPGSIHRNTLSVNFGRVKTHLELDDDIKLYSLKHTAASMLVESGFNFREIGDHFRHSSGESTNRYLRSSAPNYNLNEKLLLGYPAIKP